MYFAHTRKVLTKQKLPTWPNWFNPFRPTNCFCVLKIFFYEMFLGPLALLKQAKIKAVKKKKRNRISTNIQLQAWIRNTTSATGARINFLACSWRHPASSEVHLMYLIIEQKKKAKENNLLSWWHNGAVRKHIFQHFFFLLTNDPW